MKPADLTNPKNFTSYILLIAAIRSFTTDTELHISQFLLRRFTPNHTLCSKYLVGLVQQGLLQADISNLVLPLPNREGTSSIKLSIPQKSQQEYELLDWDLTRKNMLLSEVPAKSIAQLIQDLTVGELIEYASIYAKKYGIRFINIVIDQPKILLIVHECHLNQAFMLAWRTIKVFSEESPGKDVDFCQFADRAYKFFLEYRKLSIEIKCYIRPIELKITQVQYVIYRDLLQLCKSESEIIELLTRLNVSEQLRLLPRFSTGNIS